MRLEYLRANFRQSHHFNSTNGTDAHAATMYLWGGIASIANVEKFIRENELPYSRKGDLITITFPDKSTAVGEESKRRQSIAF